MRETSAGPSGSGAFGPAMRQSRRQAPPPEPGTAAAERRRSWHSHHERGTDQELERQCTQPKQNQWPSRLLVASVAGDVDRGLLQRVDLAEDPAEGLTILGPEVSASGFLGDLLQQRLVDAHRQQLVTETAQSSTGWNRCFTDGPHPDRIDLDAKGRCSSRRG